MIEQQVTDISEQKYLLKGLACADCAAKIEQALKKTEGIDEVDLDLSKGTLYIKSRLANERETIANIVKSFEPHVEVVPKEAKKPLQESEDGCCAPGGSDLSHGSSKVTKEMAVMVFSALSLVLLFVDQERPFIHYPWNYALALLGYLAAGSSILTRAIKNLTRGMVFDEYFLMTIATIGAFFIGALPEAVGVMLFFRIGEALQDKAIDRSRRSIESLLASRPKTALVSVGGQLVEMDPVKVSPGSIVVVKPGEKIPLDGVVVEGISSVDTSPLTGESLPLGVSPESEVKGGFMNKEGLLRIRVSKPFKESSIYKMMELVERASARKAKVEKFITTFAKYYTPVVVLLAVAVAFVPPLIMEGEAFSDWLYRALVLLVISCPCALVISIPLGYFGGIGLASARGVLIKGSVVMDALNDVKTVVFDKTGTLTEGIFKVLSVEPFNGFDESEVLKLASAAELHSNHPIARTILEEAENRKLKVKDEDIEHHQVYPGKGVKAIWKGKEVIVGTNEFLVENGIEVRESAGGATVINVAFEGKHAGSITLGDALRQEAQKTVSKLKDLGIKRLIVLSGDNQKSTEAAAGKVGISDFKGALLPEGKVEAVEEEMERAGAKDKLLFVGDGINDSPVIIRADVGVALGGIGSDAAIEVADVVIMGDSLEKIPEAICIARRTRKITLQNIALVLTVKVFFLALGAMGVATMWEAVFADVGVALLALANSLRSMKFKRTGC